MNAGVTAIGHTIVLRGEIRTEQDLRIEGRVDGPIDGEHVEVTVEANAAVDGTIVARRIRVLGRVTGTLVASERLEMCESAHVSGRVLTSTLVLRDGATFSGTVHPQGVDAAGVVAKHRQAAASRSVAEPGRVARR
jgi:cytoskeletal protein CcmA (bactofilin family)